MVMTPTVFRIAKGANTISGRIPIHMSQRTVFGLRLVEVRFSSHFMTLCNATSPQIPAAMMARKLKAPNCACDSPLIRKNICIGATINPSTSWSTAGRKQTPTSTNSRFLRMRVIRCLTSALSGPREAGPARRRRDNGPRACGALAQTLHGPLERIVRQQLALIDEVPSFGQEARREIQALKRPQPLQPLLVS